MQSKELFLTKTFVTFSTDKSHLFLSMAELLNKKACTNLLPSMARKLNCRAYVSSCEYEALLALHKAHLRSARKPHNDEVNNVIIIWVDTGFQKTNGCHDQIQQRTCRVLSDRDMRDWHFLKLTYDIRTPHQGPHQSLGGPLVSG